MKDVKTKLANERCENKVWDGNKENFVNKIPSLPKGWKSQSWWRWLKEMLILGSTFSVKAAGGLNISIRINPVIADEGGNYHSWQWKCQLGKCPSLSVRSDVCYHLLLSLGLNRLHLSNHLTLVVLWAHKVPPAVHQIPPPWLSKYFCQDCSAVELLEIAFFESWFNN